MNKGAQVRICTTNGGEIVATLTHDYKPTYPVTMQHVAGHYFTVMADRLKSIEVAA